MTTTYASVELAHFTCGKCAGTYAINEGYRQECHDKGTGWHCPYCQCSWGYFTNNRYKELKDALAKAEAQQRQTNEILTRERARHDQTKAELRETESRRRAERGAKTKLMKRAAAGVCPCCNRTFKQLASHMAAQHPEFVAAAKDAV